MEGGGKELKGGLSTTTGYLLFEVADGVLVGVREEVKDVVFDVVLLQVVHQVGAVALKCGSGRGWIVKCTFKHAAAAQTTPPPYLHLLIGCDGTEDDLREALSGEHPEADAADDAAVFDQGEGLVLPVLEGVTHRVRLREETRRRRVAVRGGGLTGRTPAG